MRALRGGVPRALPAHNNLQAYVYRAYLQSLMTRFGLSLPLDAGVRTWLREAGRTRLALDRMHSDLELLLTKANRKLEVRRLERRIWKNRGQLLGIEKHLEKIAPATRKRPLVETLAGGRA